MALAQQVQHHREPGARGDLARRVTGSPALQLVGRRLLTAIPVLLGVTFLTFVVMNLIPGLSLRATEEAEILGIDDSEIGEFAYDYVELTREVLNDMSDAESKYSGHNHPELLNPHEKALANSSAPRDIIDRVEM